MLKPPFDREFGIDPPRFRQGVLRLIHPARLRVGGGQGRIDDVTAVTRGGSLTKLGDGGVRMAKAQFRLSPLYLERAKIGVARTQPHRQLSVGLRLLEAAERES